MALQSVKLPLHETAQVVSLKLRLHETVSILTGFVISENIIEWKQNEIILVENVKSFITSEVIMVDKNHILLKWYGNPVPKIQIFKKLIGEEYGDKPFIELPWSPQEYKMFMDSNSYIIKVIGSNKTGEGLEFQIGENQDYNLNTKLELPINEIRFYQDLEIKTEYRIEVNI